MYLNLKLRNVYVLEENLKPFFFSANISMIFIYIYISIVTGYTLSKCVQWVKLTLTQYTTHSFVFLRIVWYIIIYLRKQKQ